MKVKILLVGFLGFLACVQARVTWAEVQSAEWEQFKLDYNKRYEDSSVDDLRKQIFLDNKHVIDEHNKRWALGEESYEMGVNEFTDLLDKEFDSLFEATEDGQEEGEEEDEYDVEDDFNEDLDVGKATKVDWRSLHAVSPVSNQGHFNNSWAFAAAGVVESRHFIENGKAIVLSKQNLVDCSKAKSMRTKRALLYIKKNGINSEKSYPYRGLTNKCHFNKRRIAAKVKKVYSVWGGEKRLANAVEKGPVAAVISRTALRHYKSGVFHNTNCPKTFDYAVLIVGYGHCKNCGDYWILKTSMGTKWGEQGYMKLARNKSNLCGIASRAYYPVIPHRPHAV